MSSIRQNKVARLLQRELGEIFQQQSRSLFSGAFITVTQVRITPDLQLARVYLSVLNPNKNEVMEMVQGCTPHLKNLLGKRIRRQVRQVPDLDFFQDDSLDYAQRIDDLLKK